MVTMSTGMQLGVAIPLNQGTTNRSPVSLKNAAEMFGSALKVMVTTAVQFVLEPRQRICPSVEGKIYRLFVSLVYPPG